MDYKAIEEMGGKVVKATLSYSFKRWNSEQTAGGELGAEVDIGTDADPEAVISATFVWLRDQVKSSFKDEIAETSVRVVTQSAPSKPPAPAPAAAEETIENCTMANVDGKFLKIFGGKYAKFGVPIWPEVSRNYPDLVGWEEWPAASIGSSGVVGTENMFTLPDGFTKAVVQLEGGKPKRVLRLE